MIRTALKLLTGSILAFAFTHAVRLWLFPDIVPVTINQDPQPLWELEAAFLLRAAENVAMIVAILVAAALFLELIRRSLVAR
jgi:hypothetical protein